MSDQENRFVSWVKKLVEKHDVSKTDGLSYEEWNTCFAELDETVCKIMQQQIAPLSKNYIKEMFTELDVNHDGKLSMEELTKFLRKHPAYAECESEETYKNLMNMLSSDEKSKKTDNQESRYVSWVRKLVEKYSTDKTDSLSFEEF